MNFKRLVFNVVILVFGFLFIVGSCCKPRDDHNPVITLNGDSSITLRQGTAYVEAGATATDKEDGDVKVTISGEVDTSKVGTYTITYTAIDSDNNKVTEIRTVNVINNDTDEESTPTATPSPSPSTSPLKSIFISENSISIREENSKQIKVIGRYGDNSSYDITSKVSFEIANEDIITINSGEITAQSKGTTTFKAMLNGIKSNTVSVTVTQKLDLKDVVKNSLFDQYKHLIPDDALPDSYSSDKFAIITGIAKDKSDNPIENVTIKILNHNEFGSVKTDENGKFSIPIEGGSTFTVTYRKDGYLPLDREVDVPVQNWANIKSVQMSQLDTKVTDVNLSKGETQIHSSTKIVDERGERETTLVFDGVTKATITRKDGTTKELTDIKVRATEFDKPERMPSKLPEGTAFTYCSALTVDGVEAGSDVTFDKPVIIYLDNFLGFKVGEAVPVGFYDEKKGEWEAYDDGVVVKLLDSDGDGKVDGLDKDGDNQADDLNGNGDTTDEVAGIKDESKYEAGKTYWRAEVPHFSSWDLNYGSDSDGTPPPAPPPSSPPSCGGAESSDSWIDIQTQTYYEDIPIAGTDMTLNYTSNRVKGYKHFVRAFVSGEEISSDLLEIVAKLEVAGKTYTKVLEAKPNQFVEFLWDGKDINNQKVKGTARGKVSIGYKYEAYYLKPPYARKSFGMKGSEFTDVKANPITKWTTHNVLFNIPFKNQEIANGWSLSSHHSLSNGVLQKGNGINIEDAIGDKKGLVAYWSFDDCTAKDNSGNGIDGTIHNNPECVDGIKGKALKFNGKDDYITMKLPLKGKEDWSVCSWFNAKDLNDDYTDYYNFITNGDFQLGIYTSSSKYQIWQSNGRELIEEGKVEENQDSFVCYTKENNELKIYHNGIEVGKNSNGSRINFTELNIIGMWRPNDTRPTYVEPFNGIIDELQVYNRALSEIEITGLYSSSNNNYKIIEGSLTYIFDIEGKHLQTLDTQTSKVLKTFTYDENSRLISITDRFNNKTTIQRDGEGKVTAIIAPNGQTTEIQIDEDSNIGTILYEDGSNYQFSYNDGDLMLIETEPNGNFFKHEFDETGRITKTEDEEGGWKTFTRTDSTYLVQTALGNSRNMTTNGLENQSTSNTGKQSSVIFSNNNMTKTVKSCNVETITKYAIEEKTKEKIVKEKSIKLPSGKTLSSVIERSYTFNDDNSTKTRTIKNTQNGISTTIHTDYTQGISTTTSPMGRINKQYFDTSTLLPTKSETTGINPTTYTYDIKGRLSSTTTGERTQSMTYDSRGNIATITDAEGKVTTMEYDVMGRVVKTTSPSGLSVVYSYDKNGNMTMLTTPKSNDHTFTYNKVNKKVGYSSAKASTTTYEYDLERKLKKITYPSGKELENIYTNGLLTSVKTDEGTTIFEYDCLENITKSTYGSQSVSYSYDGTLLSSLTYSGLLTKTIGFDYNNEFKLSTLSYAGDSDTLTYDKDGLLTKRGTFNITRDTDNALPLVISDGTLSTQRVYNSYAELNEISNKIGSDTLFSYSVERDKVGKITKKVESVAGASHTYEYRYDNDGRLIEVKKDGAVSESYSYDSNGNRSGSTVNEDDQLLSYKGTTYSYNDDGYLSSKKDSTGTTTYEYGIYGELKKVVLADGKVVEYLHNANHQRVAKKVDGAVVEKYLWLDLTTLLATYDKDNNLIQRFEYADNRMPIAMQQDGKKYYLHYDQVGTVKLITNSSGATIKAIEYDSYGNILSDSNPSFTIPFGFAGGLYDTNTKLTRFGYRDYDSFSGRWTAKDPIGFDGGDSNLYGYVFGDGVNFVDVNGLKARYWRGGARIIKGGLDFAGGVIEVGIGGLLLGTDFPPLMLFGGTLIGLGGSNIETGRADIDNGLDILSGKDKCPSSVKKTVTEFIVGQIGGNLLKKIPF